MSRNSIRRNDLGAVIVHFVDAGHAYVLDHAQMGEIFLSECHPETGTLDRGIVLDEGFQFFVIEQIAFTRGFEKAGLTAILGCGFDPGVSGVFTAYAAKHHFSEMEYLDIVDCNAGDHGKAFATNFNQTCVHDREVLIGEGYVDDKHGLVAVEQFHKLRNAVSIHTVILTLFIWRVRIILCKLAL